MFICVVFFIDKGLSNGVGRGDEEVRERKEKRESRGTRKRRKGRRKREREKTGKGIGRHACYTYSFLSRPHPLSLVDDDDDDDDDDGWVYEYLCRYVCLVARIPCPLRPLGSRRKNEKRKKEKGKKGRSLLAGWLAGNIYIYPAAADGLKQRKADKRNTIYERWITVYSFLFFG